MGFFDEWFGSPFLSHFPEKKEATEVKRMILSATLLPKLLLIAYDSLTKILFEIDIDLIIFNYMLFVIT